MRYNFSRVVPSDVDRLEPKVVYSIGEISCVKEMIAMSMLNNDISIAKGIGPGTDVYGVVGSYRQWPGSGQVWAIFDDRVERHPVAFLKSVIIMLNYAVQKQGLIRVSFTVRKDYTKGNRFAEALGFELEGTMRGYLPDGADANLFARLY